MKCRQEFLDFGRSPIDSRAVTSPRKLLFTLVVFTSVVEVVVVDVIDFIVLFSLLRLGWCSVY